MARHGYNRAVGTNIDFSGKAVAPTETKEELEACVKEKMEIIDDFLVGRNKLKAAEKRNLEKAMLAIQTVRGIDLYFKRFIDSRI